MGFCQWLKESMNKFGDFVEGEDNKRGRRGRR
jgi:hypothetical protein